MPECESEELEATLTAIGVAEVPGLLLASLDVQPRLDAGQATQRLEASVRACPTPEEHHRPPCHAHPCPAGRPVRVDYPRTGCSDSEIINRTECAPGNQGIRSQDGARLTPLPIAASRKLARVTNSGLVGPSESATAADPDADSKPPDRETARFKSCRPDFFQKEALRRERRRAFSLRGQELRRRACSSNRRFRGFDALHRNRR